jgi:acyl carrier protein
MLTAETVKSFLATFTRVPLEKIEDDTPMMELVAESFMMVELMLALQEDLGVDLVHEDLEGVQSVGELIEVLQSRSCAGAARAEHFV